MLDSKLEVYSVKERAPSKSLVSEHEARDAAHLSKETRLGLGGRFFRMIEHVCSGIKRAMEAWWSTFLASVACVSISKLSVW